MTPRQPLIVYFAFGLICWAMAGGMLLSGELHMKGGGTLHSQDLGFKLFVGWMIFFGLLVMVIGVKKFRSGL